MLLSTSGALVANGAVGTTYTVTMAKKKYLPANQTVALGDSVKWYNKSAYTRNAIPTFASAWGPVTVAPKHTSSPVTLTQAGTFPYASGKPKRMKGKIIVPMTVSPSAGNTGTFFLLTLGTEKAPGVLVHDVYVRQNGGSWQGRAATAEPTISIFFPTAGTWDIHTRLRYQLGGATSDWTPDVTVQVI